MDHIASPTLSIPSLDLCFRSVRYAGWVRTSQSVFGVFEGNGVLFSTGVSVGQRVSVGTGVSVGAGVLVGTGVSVGHCVSVGIGVSVGAGVLVGTGVSVGHCVSVGIGVSVGAGVLVGTGVSVGQRVSVGTGVLLEFTVDSDSASVSSSLWFCIGGMFTENALTSLITIPGSSIVTFTYLASTGSKDICTVSIPAMG